MRRRPLLVASLSAGRAASWRWLAPSTAAAAGGDDATSPAPAPAPATDVASASAALRRAFAVEVDAPLDVPACELAAETALLEASLARAGVELAVPECLVLVDRSPHVQAAIVLLGTTRGGWFEIGSTAVSTGLPGRFDHFETPLGVFEHTPANPDFRAEGTRNSNGIRGYGRKGMRVYDFGWVRARKGWGDRAEATMRLQMHATDPDSLERRLGSAQSKGCIRIPATLNAFIDRHGVLDAAYEAAAAAGSHFRVLRADRLATTRAGRWLVVVDSQRSERPRWAPSPRP